MSKSREPLIRDGMLTRGIGQEDIGKQDSEQLFENSLVHWLFVRHKISALKRQYIERQHAQRTGQQGLILDCWNQAFLGYPVWYASWHIPEMAKALPLTTLFCRMDRSRLVQAYLKKEEELEDDRRLAMIVRWPRLKALGETSGALVLHDRQFSATCAAVRMSWDMANADGDILTLQTMSSFVQDIDLDYGGRWTPNE